MRIDGPAFRGRPLGHRLDPLRCILDTLEPDDFLVIVKSLLAAYEFDDEQELDARLLLDSQEVWLRRGYVTA
jgi:hypothetical protein